jgi:zinc protease
MMRRATAGATVATAVAVAVAVACSCVPATPKQVFTFGEIRGQLPRNGLRFIVMPDPTTQLVEVDVRYEVGAREDPPGKAGLAHLVEHLMFQQQPGGPGTPTLLRTLQQLTLNMNAYTNWDTTHYMVNARVDHLDTLVKLEATRMHDGCRTLSAYEFLREREVVRNELRSRTRSPEALIAHHTLAAIYPPGHAYARMVGGDDEQLSTITMEDACEFIRQYYVPERAVVIVAGGVAPDRAIRSIEQWFNRIDKRTPAPRRVVEPLAATGGRNTMQLDIERPWVTVAWPLPDARSPEGKAAQFGFWAAFLNIAYSTDRHDCATRSVPRTLGGREAPVFTLALELSSMTKLDECLDHVWQAARDAGYGWYGERTIPLEPAKNRRKAELLSSLERLFGHGSRTDQIADMAQFSRDIDFHSRDIYVFHELARIDKLEMSEILSAMQRALDRDRARVTVFAPSKHEMTGTRRSTVWFDATPHHHDAPDLDPSEAQRPIQIPAELTRASGATRFQLDNGLRVVLMPVDAMPVVAAQLIFDAGDATTPDTPGLSTAAAELIAFPRRSGPVWQTGMRVRCGATADHTICAAHGVSLHLDVMLHGLARLIRDGDYLDANVKRWQRLTRARYQLERTHQELEFERQQLAAIYGPDHPYTRTIALAPDAVDKLEAGALSAFRHRHYTAANATLVLVGMFDVQHAERQVRQAFGDWRREHSSAAVLRSAHPRTAPVHVAVIGDDDPQVDVALLYPSPPGLAGDQAARMVLTRMLDDQMERIREGLGATYGIHARRNARVSASAYHMEGAVDAARAGEALRAMRAGIDDLRSGSSFDAMFVRARRKVVQELVGGSTVSTELASRLGQIAQFGLSPTHGDDLLRETATLVPARVKQLLARELDPRGEVIVLLGDRTAVTRAFAEAGIPTPKLVVPDARQR